MFNGDAPRAAPASCIYSRLATNATILRHDSRGSRSSAETTEAASVDATGTRASKISTSATRPLLTSTILAATSTWTSDRRRVEFEGANVEIELVVGARTAAGERPGEPGVLEGLD